MITIDYYLLLEEKHPCINGLSYFFVVVNLIIATAMVAVGFYYQYEYLYVLVHVSQSLTQENVYRTPCPNGAAYWLYAAGICLLVSYCKSN